MYPPFTLTAMIFSIAKSVSDKVIVLSLVLLNSYKKKEEVARISEASRRKLYRSYSKHIAVLIFEVLLGILESDTSL